jgi:hypothetical protein
MTRTKIRQEIQINNSESYNDAYAAAHTAGGAEPAFGEANIEHDLNVLRTNMKDLKGTSNWFDVTGHSIEAIDAYVNQLQAFVGSADGESSPTYASAVVVTQGSSLEAAIGAIDAYISVLDPIVTLQDAFDNSQSQGQTSPEIALGANVDLNINGTGTSKLHVQAAGGLEVDNATKLDGALQYTVSPVAGHFLKTDASGNASWTQILGSDVDVTAGTTIGAGASTAQQYLDQLEDGYDYHEVEINNLESATGTTGGAATNNYSSNDLVVDGTSLLVAIGALDDGYGSLLASMATLDVTAGAGMTETGSLQAGTLTFDVVGTAGQITALADSIKVADAFSKTDFSSFQATSSGGINLDATSSAVSIDAGATSNVTVTGGGDLNLQSVTGELDLEGGTVAMDSTTSTILASGTTFAVNATGAMTLDSAAASVVSGASVELASDGGNVILDASADIVFEDGDGTYSNTVADGYVWTTKTTGTGAGKWAKLDTLVSGLVTLQEAFNASHTAGDNPDISVDAGEDLDIFLTDSTSKFLIKDGNDNSPSLEVTSNYFKVYGTHSDSPTLLVNTVDGDGYVLIDGYLAITGNAIQIETVVTDADHMLLSPGVGSTAPALEIAPDSGNTQALIDVHAVSDGYAGNNIVFRIENDGDAYFSRNVLVQPGAGQYFQYDHSTATAGYYLKSIDASGNSEWSDFSALAGSGLTFAGGDFDVNVVAGETIIDGDAVGIDEAFSKTNFTSFVATSSGGMSLTATASNMSLTAGGTLTGTITGAMTLDSAAAATLSGANVEIDSDGGNILLDSSAEIVFEDGAGTYLNTVADSYVWSAKSTGTGQGKWSILSASNLTVTDTFDVTNSTNLQTILDDFDAYMVDSRMQIDTTQTSIGAAISATGAWVGFTGTTLLDPSTSISNALELLDDGYTSLQSSMATLDVTAGDGMAETGSLQAGTLTFNVVGTAGEITANANDIQIANAFSKTNFSSFQATSSGGINLDATSSAVSIDAAADSNFTVTGSGNDLSLGSVDGYLYFEDKHLNADGYTSGVALSTNLLMPSSGWSASIIAAAGGTSIADIGIIDAINAAASLGGGKVEKAVYVIGASDARLFNTGALTGNGLDLDAGSGADRGSIDLASVGLGHKMERDLEVFVNGVLQLADETQGTATGSASDDYYVASNDLTRIVFSFALVEGDVITVVNRKADSVEDVDAGWTY